MLPSNIASSIQKLPCYKDKSYQTTEFPIYQVTVSPSFQVFKFPSYQVTDLPSYQVTKLLNYRVTKFPSFQDSEFWSYWVTKLQSFWVSEFPSFWVFKYLCFQFSKFPSYQVQIHHSQGHWLTEEDLRKNVHAMVQHTTTHRRTSWPNYWKNYINVTLPCINS